MSAERLGKYELVRHLASGGMASVYLARVSGLGGFQRHVVLKTLQSDGLEDDSLVPMFLDEARLVATLHHQHIAQVYEVGRHDTTYFLAMEYIHGETIRGVLETAGKHGQILPLDFGLTVVCAAAAGLHHAHERRNIAGVPLGIVHRDVTPSNVIVSFDGSIKLIDFGIAKANDRSTKTRSGFIKGKAGYMAPEQVKGYLVDRRSDVFALGVLAYELTTQMRAFQADSQFAQLERIANGNITPPSELVPGYPVELEDVVMRALEVDPDDRYPDAHVARNEFERVARELHLALGEDSVMRVLDGLYGPRPEPWLVTPGLIDYDITPSIAEIPLAIEVLHPRPTTHGFTATLARGSKHDLEAPHRDAIPEQPCEADDVTNPVDLADVEVVGVVTPAPAVAVAAVAATVAEPVRAEPVRAEPVGLATLIGVAPVEPVGFATDVDLAGALALAEPVVAEPLVPNRRPMQLPAIPRHRATTLSTKLPRTSWRGVLGVAAAIAITGATTLAILYEVDRRQPSEASAEGHVASQVDSIPAPATKPDSHRGKSESAAVKPTTEPGAKASPEPTGPVKPTPDSHRDPDVKPEPRANDPAKPTKAATAPTTTPDSHREPDVKPGPEPTKSETAPAVKATTEPGAKAEPAPVVKPITEPGANASPDSHREPDVAKPEPAATERAKTAPTSQPAAPVSAAAPGRIVLDVVSNPPGASVVLDGVKLGTSPFHAEIPAKKSAVLKVRRSDRTPVKIKVALDRDYRWTVTLPPRR